MEIEFLGVGEACDPACFNTALLLKVKQGATGNYILLDCGFTTPHRFFLNHHDAEQPAAVWISHFHGDHFFGLPLLLLRFWEMGRRAPLLVVGPKGVADKAAASLDLAYPGFARRLQYPLRFVEAVPGMELREAGCHWRFAAMDHSQSALAVRLDIGEASLFYSGDGRGTTASQALARGCDCLVHEAYGVERETANHGTVAQCLELAAASGCQRLALVHVAQAERQRLRHLLPELTRKVGLDCAVLLPEPGERWRFCAGDQAAR